MQSKASGAHWDAGGAADVDAIGKFMHGWRTVAAELELLVTLSTAELHGVQSREQTPLSNMAQWQSL